MSLFSIESYQIRGHFDPIISLKHLKNLSWTKIKNIQDLIKMQQIYSTSSCQSNKAFMQA